MTTDHRYNGYTNYETWAVALWIDNEQSTQQQWRAAAEDQMRRARMYPSATFTVSEDARYQLADMLKEEITDAAPAMGGTLYDDLLNAALSEVDWADVADNLLSDSDGYVAHS